MCIVRPPPRWDRRELDFIADDDVTLPVPTSANSTSPHIVMGALTRGHFVGDPDGYCDGRGRDKGQVAVSVLQFTPSTPSLQELERPRVQNWSFAQHLLTMRPAAQGDLLHGQPGDQLLKSRATTASAGRGHRLRTETVLPQMRRGLRARQHGHVQRRTLWC